MNEELYEKAKQAIQDLFNDTSVDEHTALENLQGLRDEIDILIDALENQIGE